jgi:hypothetical protein
MLDWMTSSLAKSGTPKKRSLRHGEGAPRAGGRAPLPRIASLLSQKSSP